VIACLMPNVSLGFMLDHLLHCEIEGGTGLTLETASMPYQSFNFMLGLACQLVCSFLWAIIGLYLDKVMPREFGKAEPWNFLCKNKRRATIVNESEEETYDPELV
jgi:ATP-binding cassette subfamily A (ABC1) protein 3